MAAQLTKAFLASPNTEIRHRAKLEMAASTTIYQGAMVGFSRVADATKGYLVPMGSGACTFVGFAKETVANSGAAGAAKCEVEFVKPKHLIWRDNDATHTCAAADRGGLGYAESDHEVGNTAGSPATVGTIFEIGSAADGTSGLVAVEV